MSLGWVAALALLLLTGCAGLPGPVPPKSAEEGGPSPAQETTTAAPASNLEVVAPDELKTLLERYLDLARVGRLGDGDAIDDTEWTRLIGAAPAQVRELLQTEGYFEPQVTVTRLAEAVGPTRRVRLLVDPGPRTTVARVTLDVEGELERAAFEGDAFAKSVLADFQRDWALPVGTPFRNPAWSSAKAAALARLRAAGYATATWSGTGAEVDALKHQAQLFLVADSGPLFRFGKLQIEGLVTQDAQTVHNLANFDVGVPVSETLLLDYQERLRKAGLFDSVTVALDTDPVHAAQAVIEVRLREAPLQVYTFGVGVSANTGPRASAEHLYRRVFGYAATARNKLEWGRLRQAWDGEISTHPGEGLYRELLGGAVERLETSSDVVLSQRLRLGRTQDLQRIDRLYFVEAERSVRTTDIARANTLALSLNYHFVWRDLDSLLLPTRGLTLSLQGGVGQARSTAAQTGPFSRLFGRVTVYQPLGGTWYGQARLELGQVVKNEAVDVPDSQLFRAGGDDSVRGYSYRSLGPLVGGAVSGGATLMTSSVELARPFSAKLPSVWGAVFVDYGGAANNLQSLTPVLGTGVGVRWRSPVGPLRLDWAWGREVHQARLHFSVGVAF